MGRPRLPESHDVRLARRRQQYRNAKRRARGQPEEASLTFRAPEGSRRVSVLIGTTWVAALIAPDGERVFLL